MTTKYRQSNTKRIINPTFFQPRTESEWFALSIWKLLGDRKDSFPFYLYAAKRVFQPNLQQMRKLAEEIATDPAVKNRGAAFVVKVRTYERKIEEQGQYAE